MRKIPVLPLLLLAVLTFQGNYTSSKLSNSMLGVLGKMSDKDSLICWVFFTDKGPATEALLAKPENVVSKRSIERRMKYLPQDRILDASDLPVFQGYIDQLEALGTKVKGKSKWLNSVSLKVAKTDIKKIESLHFVKNLDLVSRFSKRYQSEVPTEAQNNQKSLRVPDMIYDLDYGPSLTQNQMMQVPALHNLGITGTGVMVGVFDAGFNRLDHEAFAQLDIHATWDFVNGDPGVGDSLDMGEGSHGTNVLSAIAGYKPGSLIGPAYGATFLLAKTENTDSETPVEEDNWIAAMEWADSIGVDIVTSSLGYLEYDPPFQSYTWQNMDGNTARITVAADLAVGKGIAVFVSAGNEGMNATHNTLGAPADGDSVVSVGATDNSGSRAYFSSVGPTSDGRIKPDIMAMGQGVRVASYWTANGYGLASGTSFSCPLAAGVAALVLSQRSWITPMQLAEALKSTASNSLSPNREYGWGMINGLAALNSIPVSGIHDEVSLPSGLRIIGNYPNPFNPSTKVDFEIPSSSVVKFDLYNAAGEKVMTLSEQQYSAGRHSFDLSTGSINSGVYFLKISTEKGSGVIKVILAR